jgi:hypothetical protein
MKEVGVTGGAQAERLEVGSTDHGSPLHNPTAVIVSATSTETVN